MLYKLLSSMDQHRFRSEVVTFSDVGAVGRKIISDLGIPVFCLSPGGCRQTASGAMGLLSHFSRSRPHLIQTWMYHANLLGGIAGRALGRPVIWSIRHGSLADLKPLTHFISRLCSLISASVPARIVCCSSDSLKHHVAAGYVRARMTVIPNGFDVVMFQPNAG
jgi:hypothetical protein